MAVMISRKSIIMGTLLAMSFAGIKSPERQRRNKTASLPRKMFTLIRLRSIQREIEAICRGNTYHELVRGPPLPDNARILGRALQARIFPKQAGIDLICRLPVDGAAETG